MRYAGTLRYQSPAPTFSTPGATKADSLRSIPRCLLTIASIVTLALAPVTVAVSANAVPLGAAGSFAVLGASTVTNTGSTIVTGDVGLSPGTSVTGFPPGVVTGVLRVNDGIAATAQANNVTAYGLLAVQACDVTFAGPTDMAGMTLLPGTYCFNSSGSNTGLLTLNGAGNSNAVWIFRTASTLTTGAGSSVVATNGAQACNVFWQVGSSATFGTNTRMLGNVLALTSITANTGSSISGRTLAQTGAVTLDTNSVSVCSIAPFVAPTLAKAFNLATINAGATSRLTVTLANQNSFPITTTAPLTDNLPSGVVIAPVPNVSTTCGGGVVASATAGGNTVTLPTGAGIGVNSSCTVSVDVTAALAGSYVNTLPTGALQTSNGSNALPAAATLTVVGGIAAISPTLTKAFSPPTIITGGVSTLTITLRNSNLTVATLTASLVDTLPAGVFIASIPAGATTCGGGTAVTATAGGTTVTLPSGRTIPANGSCTVSVSVTSAAIGNYVNTLPVGALQTSNGNNPASANATLDVVSVIPPVTPTVAAAVPAIAPWMLGILAAVLGVFGFVALRRRW